jgi:hypothetical protein
MIRPQPHTIQGLIDELVLERFAPLPAAVTAEVRARRVPTVDVFEERQRVLLEMDEPLESQRLAPVVPLRREGQAAA